MHITASLMTVMARLSCTTVRLFGASHCHVLPACTVVVRSPRGGGEGPSLGDRPPGGGGEPSSLGGDRQGGGVHEEWALDYTRTILNFAYTLCSSAMFVRIVLGVGQAGFLCVVFFCTQHRLVQAPRPVTVVFLTLAVLGQGGGGTWAGDRCIALTGLCMCAGRAGHDGGQENV